MNEYNFEIHFRVTHPTLCPEKICSLLGLDADIKREVGQPRATLKGKPLPGFWKETYCGFLIPRTETDSIFDCIKTLLNKLDKKKDTIEKIKSTGGFLELYILASPVEETFGERLSWKIMDELARLKIDISLEIHK